MTRREKSDLKTLNRRLKIVRVRSRKHKQATFVKPIKAEPRKKTQYTRKTISKFRASEPLYMDRELNNYLILQSLGYSTTPTKAKKNALRILPRNVLGEDGLTCRERRMQQRIIDWLAKGAA